MSWGFLGQVPNTQNGDDVIRKSENDTMRGPPTDPEANLPYALGQQIRFRGP